LKKYRVCVADDNEENASILCEGLILHGFEAVAAHDGTEALEICGRGDVGLLLLDVCMPGIDGYEVCRRLKENPATKDIIVIFVTVRGGRDDIAQGFKMGATDFITKPYNLPMVVVRVEAAISSHEAQHMSESSPEALADTAYTDMLTGLRNRRYLIERLDEEVEKSHRYNFPVSCVLFDLDEIEAQDDELGPASMDDVLTEVAMAMRNYTRSFDILARYEGTMFVAVLPHTPLGQASNYATKILEDLEGTTLSDPCFPTTATMSVGITSCSNGVAFGAEYVLGEAMRGLLQAKTKSGRRITARDLDQ
jgi:diguanylate cyclase (GGDEF)-like protein